MYIRALDAANDGWPMMGFSAQDVKAGAAQGEASRQGVIRGECGRQQKASAHEQVGWWFFNGSRKTRQCQRPAIGP